MGFNFISTPSATLASHGTISGWQSSHLFACKTVVAPEGVPTLAKYNTHSLRGFSSCSFSCFAPGNRRLCLSARTHPPRSWIHHVRRESKWVQYVLTTENAVSNSDFGRRSRDSVHDIGGCQPSPRLSDARISLFLISRGRERGRLARRSIKASTDVNHLSHTRKPPSSIGYGSGKTVEVICRVLTHLSSECADASMRKCLAEDLLQRSPG